MEGKYCIVLIEDMDKSNAASANSLLKVLEEPPPYVIFILLSKDPSLLLATITSRCHTIQFPSLSKRRMMECLKKEFPEEEQESIQRATLWSESSFEHAHRFLKDENVTEKIKKASNMLISLWKAFPSIPSIHMESVEIPRSKEDIDILLHTWILLLRDISLMAVNDSSANPSEIFHSTHIRELQSIIEKLGIEKVKEDISSKMEYIHQSKEHLDFNGNPKLVLGNLICKIQFSP